MNQRVIQDRLDLDFRKFTEAVDEIFDRTLPYASKQASENVNGNFRVIAQCGYCLAALV